MKKSDSTGKGLSSRLLFKLGSVLFLIFFIAFILSAPLAAQFGSFFFILFGALCFANDPEDRSVPPVPDKAIYSAVDSYADDNVAEVQPLQPQYLFDIPRAVWQIAEKQTPFRHLLIYNSTQELSTALVCSNLVRAGPRAGGILQAG